MSRWRSVGAVEKCRRDGRWAWLEPRGPSAPCPPPLLELVVAPHLELVVAPHLELVIVSLLELAVIAPHLELTVVSLLELTVVSLLELVVAPRSTPARTSVGG
jgi:hypothetical protein